MRDKGGTREQLIAELAEMRRRVSELERLQLMQKRTEAEIERNTRRLEGLYAVVHAVNQALDLQELLESVLGKVVEAVGADTGSMYLVDLEKESLVLRAHRGISREVARLISTIELDEEDFHRVLQWRDPNTPYSEVVRQNSLDLMAEALEKARVQSFAIVPISVKDEVQGMLSVGSRTQREFAPDDIDLLKTIGRDIAVGIENARLFEEMSTLAITDGLTALYNRRHFYQALETEIYRARRYGRSFAVAMLDLDRFKEYNDKFGHLSGDDALRAFAQTLKSTLRRSDMAFRYGGDEFAIILPETNSDTARQTLGRVRSKWQQMSEVQHHLLEAPIGISAGFAQFPEDADTVDGLVLHADAALYRAKSK